MRREIVKQIHQMRRAGHSVLQIETALGVEVPHYGNIEPTEDTLVDGERLEDRVARMKADLWKKKLAALHEQSTDLGEMK